MKMVKYKCDHPGSTIGANSGKYLQWKEGEEFLCQEGDVDHVKGMTKVKQKKSRKKSSKK